MSQPKVIVKRAKTKSTDANLQKNNGTEGLKSQVGESIAATKIDATPLVQLTPISQPPLANHSIEENVSSFDKDPMSAKPNLQLPSLPQQQDNPNPSVPTSFNGDIGDGRGRASKMTIGQKKIMKKSQLSMSDNDDYESIQKSIMEKRSQYVENFGDDAIYSGDDRWIHSTYLSKEMLLLLYGQPSSHLWFIMLMCILCVGKILFPFINIVVACFYLAYDFKMNKRIPFILFSTCFIVDFHIPLKIPLLPFLILVSSVTDLYLSKKSSNKKLLDRTLTIAFTVGLVLEWYWPLFGIPCIIVILDTILDIVVTLVLRFEFRRVQVLTGSIDLSHLSKSTHWFLLCCRLNLPAIDFFASSSKRSSRGTKREQDSKSLADEWFDSHCDSVCQDLNISKACLFRLKDSMKLSNPQWFGEDKTMIKPKEALAYFSVVQNFYIYDRYVRPYVSRVLQNFVDISSSKVSSSKSSSFLDNCFFSEETFYPVCKKSFWNNPNNTAPKTISHSPFNIALQCQVSRGKGFVSGKMIHALKFFSDLYFKLVPFSGMIVNGAKFASIQLNFDTLVLIRFVESRIFYIDIEETKKMAQKVFDSSRLTCDINFDASVFYGEEAVANS